MQRGLALTTEINVRKIPKKGETSRR